MAEPVNGGGNNPVLPPKEMSMEMRLLLAFLLMGAVMFVFQYLFPQAPPPDAKKQAAAAALQKGQTQAPAPAETPAAPAPAAKAATAASNPSATPQATLPPLVIETDLYKVSLSNQGGTIRSWQLK
jgi:YidC/Oxa1 family membrane protein insertase